MRHFQVHTFLGEVKKEEVDVTPFMACLLEWPCHQGTAIIFGVPVGGCPPQATVQHSRVCEFPCTLRCKTCYPVRFEQDLLT